MRALVLIATLSVALVSETYIAAQNTRTVWDGVYTEDQAKRGKTAYLDNCAACHVEDMTGDTVTPALVGDPFVTKWNTKSLHELFELIKTTMPQSDPGSLPDATYADALAAILEANKFPTGSQELKPDPAVLKAVTLLQTKP
jgi:quinoprotein glucose dehydrogenase